MSLPVAGSRTGLGDQARVTVVVVQDLERVAGVVGVGEDEVDVGDVGDRFFGAVGVHAGGDVPDLGAVLGAAGQWWWV